MILLDLVNAWGLPMIRMKAQKDAKKGEAYYGRSDGGYYADANGLHCEWGGKLAARLGLDGPPQFEQFKNLLHGLHPNSGEQLTAKLLDGRISYWDVTGSVPKGVTLALERGDERIQAAIWQAVREAVAMLETYATTRVRVEGKQEDRVTGELVWYAQEHADTRPTVNESLPENHPWRVMPSPDRHVHVVIPNATWDDEEKRIKALKFRPIMDIRKYFDRCFDTILAGKLANELGYEIEMKWKEDGRYHSWDIKDIPATLVAKNSPRSKEIDALEDSIVASRKEAARLAGVPDWDKLPDELSAVEADKLGATSRRLKRDDLTLAECREYWASLYDPDEAAMMDDVIRRAREGLNAKPENRADKALEFAFRHWSEQLSVIRWEELAATAMEHSIGAATPAEIEQAAKKMGLIFGEENGKRVVTSEALQAEERYIAGIAAGGRSSVAPIGVPEGLTRTLPDGKRLNDGQWNIVTGLLESSNRVNLVLGPAGAGKSWSLQKFDEAARLSGQNVTYLATTAKAVKVLADDGFEVNTLARFIRDEKMQAAAAGGRVVVDESSMLGHKDAVRLFKIAEKLNLKLVFVGDEMQHGSVPRGAFLKVMKEYGNVNPFRLSEIMRQNDPELRQAAQLLSEGKTVQGFAVLDGKGCVHHIADDAARYRDMAMEYVQAVGEGKKALVVSPTHYEAGRITSEIRHLLRERGTLGTEEVTFSRLVASGASEAQRGLAQTYRVGDVLQYQQNAKGVKKGTRVIVTDPAKVPLRDAGKFSHYRPEAIALAVGDKIRFTGTVTSKDGKHKLRNGDTHTVAGFTATGFRLENGWLMAADVGHFRSAFVETSFGAQGQTVQKVILGMSSHSLAATNQEQMYVSATRAKESVSLYTDDKAAVREAIQESSQKLAALDLVRVEDKDAKERTRRAQELTRRRVQAYLASLPVARSIVPPPQPQRPGPGGGISHAERYVSNQGWDNQHGR
jgi:conjugative relaxase-like TrwC/TraI family protein